MTDFTARITEILTTHQDVDLGVEGERSWLAAFLAAAAEEHYRPRIETVERLDALPEDSVINDAHSCTAKKHRETWWWIGTEDPWEPDLPATLLWSPGAGE